MENWIIVPPNYIAQISNVKQIKFPKLDTDGNDLDAVKLSCREVTLIYIDDTTETAVTKIPCPDFIQLVKNVQSHHLRKGLNFFS
jgi:hypothetical protein